jgi:hypothetical protein
MYYTCTYLGVVDKENVRGGEGERHRRAPALVYCHYYVPVCLVSASKLPGGVSYVSQMHRIGAHIKLMHILNCAHPFGHIEHDLILGTKRSGGGSPPPKSHMVGASPVLVGSQLVAVPHDEQSFLGGLIRLPSRGSLCKYAAIKCSRNQRPEVLFMQLN